MSGSSVLTIVLLRFCLCADFFIIFLNRMDKMLLSRSAAVDMMTASWLFTEWVVAKGKLRI